MNRLLTASLSFAAGVATAYFAAPERCVQKAGAVTVLRYTDTVRVTVPELIVVRAKGEERAVLACADSADGDSVAVKVPVAQRVYAGDSYTAYVSGFRAVLDSIEVYSTRTESLVTLPSRRKRFAVGVQAGVGVTPRGVEPFVGVGITLKLWEF